MLNLDPKAIFQWHDDTELRRRVMLLFSEERRPIQDSLARELQSLDSSVYTAGTAGSWEHFRAVDPGKSRVVIIDAPLRRHLHRIPNLHNLVYCKANFFQYDDPKLTPDSSAVAPLLNPILPNGHAIWILDSCFRTKARKTLEVVTTMASRVRHPTPTKILGRPDLLDWLSELEAEAHRSESSNAFISDNDTIANVLSTIQSTLYDILNSDPTYTDDTWSGYTQKPSEASPVFYCSTEDWPEYGETVAEDQDRADDLAVGWFAEWAIDNAATIRKFTVITTASDQQIQRWQGRWMHVAFKDPKEYVDFNRQTTRR